MTRRPFQRSLRSTIGLIIAIGGGACWIRGTCYLMTAGLMRTSHSSASRTPGTDCRMVQSAYAQVPWLVAEPQRSQANFSIRDALSYLSTTRHRVAVQDLSGDCGTRRALESDLRVPYRSLKRLRFLCEVHSDPLREREWVQHIESQYGFILGPEYLLNGIERLNSKAAQVFWLGAVLMLLAACLNPEEQP